MSLLHYYKHEKAEREIAKLVAEITDRDDPMRQAIKALAMMTKHAPSYWVVVLPFAVAHQEATRILAELQALGIQEAK